MDAHLSTTLPPMPDPTDWDQTRLPQLHPLDAALRCQICKDFFTAPVLTACQHTFCSECIRRALHAGKICPVCRAPEQEYRLRKNQVVEDLVDAFVAARGEVLRVAREVGEGGGRRKRRRVEDGEEEVEVEVKEEVKEEVLVKEEVKEEVVGEVPPPDDGLVPCPLCKKRLKLTLINPHLDTCLSARANSSTAPTPTPLPKINYSTIKERDLRAKLQALGIPSAGARKALQERHTEWVTLWNANIDARRPRTKAELLADLAAWERANARPSNQIVRARWSDERWGEEHRGAYDRLVEAARAPRGKRGAAVQVECRGDAGAGEKRKYVDMEGGGGGGGGGADSKDGGTPPPVAAAAVL